MVRTQVQLTEEQSRVLKRIASEKGVSVAELIRRGIDILLTQEMEPDIEELRRRAIEAAGKFQSGKSDVAEKHDEYLAEAYRPWLSK